MRHLILLLVLSSSVALADEGMWTLDNLPVKAIQDKYGFAPDAAWADKVMRSSVRLAGGCSGSFVSKNGLVLTNHHCVRSCVAQLSTETQDYNRDGFLARSHSEELVCPEIELNRLEQITDVTASLAKATAGKSGAEFHTAKQAEKSRLESACAGADKDKVRCDVVELYHGGVYQLYRYKRFQDVRLAFAPEEGIAFFGGDPDNFNFPRYNLDMSLLRAYEGGQPARIDDYFGFQPAGAKTGELTFITGHPGSTDRQLTVSQLERTRDVDLIPRLLWLAEYRGVLSQYSALGAEATRVARDDLFGVENAFKALKGRLGALQDPSVFELKRAEETQLRTAVAANPQWKKDYGSAWEAVVQAQKSYRNVEVPYKLLERGRGFYSSYFRNARDLVRGAEERSKPNDKRLREYTDARLPALTQRLFSSAPIYPDFEKVTLGWSLGKLREELGTDDPFVKRVLGKQSPEALARQWVDGTTLGDVAVRKALWEGGAKAIKASKDPFIQLARAIDAESRAVRKSMEDNVEAVESKAAEQIAAARFKLLGTGVYPDATFSLRLSYGAVDGWVDRGVKIAPFTDIAGGFARHTGEFPFALPESWLKSKNKLNLKQPFNFVTTHDIIGGNSGSPVINRKAEIIGLVFDGNIHSLGGAYWYDAALNRAVSVHSGAILEAMRKIYGADTLADELSAR